MQAFNPKNIFTSILNQNTPAATARIQGDTAHPNLFGIVTFYNTPFGGVLVNAEVYGLPGSGFYGMHIHEFGDCSQTPNTMQPGSMPPVGMRPPMSMLPPAGMQSFPNTGNHYNPENMPHPEHAGDLPPLLSSNGYAWMTFYTGRLNVEDIIGRSLVIHSMRDDFTTQPAGDSDDKIGCGVIFSD